MLGIIHSRYEHKRSMGHRLVVLATQEAGRLKVKGLVRCGNTCF